MVEIEFLDPGPWQDAAPAPAPARPSPPGVWGSVRLLGPPVLWLAAAVLVAVAPFQRVYSLSLSASGFGSGTWADGWGRLHQANVPFTEHESRYGIVLCVAAALFLVAAGLAVLAATGRAGPARLASAGIGLTGAALATGTVAAALLYLQSLHDNIEVELRAATSAHDLSIGPALTSVHLKTGWMVWLTIAAVACAIAALVLQSLPEHRAPAEPPPPVVEPVPHPQDELLDDGQLPPIR